MTLIEARDLLKTPRFGDQRCIEAKRVIEDEAESAHLRSALEGKKVECWCCNGRRYLSCAVGCLDKYHPCHTCGAQPKLTLAAGVLKDLVLYQLRDLAKELGVPVLRIK